MKLHFRKKRQTALLVLLFVAVVAVTSLAAWSIFMGSIYQTIELPMEVYVDNIAGFDVSKDQIRFGIVPPGSGSSRMLTVTAADERTLVSIDSNGDITPWIDVSKNNFMLEPGQNTTVEVSVSVPQDVKPLAFRNGTLRITFRRAF